MQTLFPNKIFYAIIREEKVPMRQAFSSLTRQTLAWISLKAFRTRYIVKEKPCLKKLSLKALSWITPSSKRLMFRLIGEETGPKGDIISNFDIRLVQLNEDSIPTAGLHTIEHLLAMLDPQAH